MVHLPTVFQKTVKTVKNRENRSIKRRQNRAKPLVSDARAPAGNRQGRNCISPVLRYDGSRHENQFPKSLDCSQPGSVQRSPIHLFNSPEALHKNHRLAQKAQKAFYSTGGSVCGQDFRECDKI
jgi:hypothetical protein